MSSRPIRSLPSRNGSMVSNWRCLSAHRTSVEVGREALTYSCQSASSSPRRSGSGGTNVAASGRSAGEPTRTGLRRSPTGEGAGQQHPRRRRPAAPRSASSPTPPAPRTSRSAAVGRRPELEWIGPVHGAGHPGPHHSAAPPALFDGAPGHGTPRCSRALPRPPRRCAPAPAPSGRARRRLIRPTHPETPPDPRGQGSSCGAPGRAGTARARPDSTPGPRRAGRRRRGR